MKKRYEIDLKRKIIGFDEKQKRIIVGHLDDDIIWESFKPKQYVPTMDLIKKGLRNKNRKPLISLVIEYEDEALDKIEKKYLENVIRPFKNRDDIVVVRNQNNNKYNFLSILIGDDELRFPDFPKDTMYKGMEVDREYTIEELGLFQ